MGLSSGHVSTSKRCTVHSRTTWSSSLLIPSPACWFPLQEHLGMQAEASWRALQEVPIHDQGPEEGSNAFAGKCSPTCSPYRVSLRSAGLHFDPISRSRKVSAEPEPCLSIMSSNIFNFFFFLNSHLKIHTDQFGVDLLNKVISKDTKLWDISLHVTEVLGKVDWKLRFGLMIRLHWEKVKFQ